MRPLLLSIYLLAHCGFASEQIETRKKGPGWSYERLGNPQNVTTRTELGILFGGGGTDVDDAFRWMCKKSGNGDFLIIRATGTAAYNPYIRGLCPEGNSVATLIIGSRAAANDRFVAATIRDAEALFISGGDQANYANFWQGTPVAQAIDALAQRHVPIGGTSAGNAMLGQYAFSALRDTITSQQALSDPFSPLITIDKDFLRLSPVLRDTITDDHFVTRDRMGRLITFLARILQESGGPQISGIAIDDRTAFLMEPDGSGRAVGSGNVYFLRANHPSEVLHAGAPLTFQNIAVYRIRAGATFKLAAWKGDGGVLYSISAVNGSLQSTQPTGVIY